MSLVSNIVQGMSMKIQLKWECKTKTQKGHGIGDKKKGLTGKKGEKEEHLLSYT